MQQRWRTDLAMEARELNPLMEGVLEEERDAGDVRVTTVTVQTQQAARRLGKPCGRFVTLDAPNLPLRDAQLFEKVSRELAREITRLLPPLSNGAQVLVVGLGNRFVTPDALGPRVAEKVHVTRHIMEYMRELIPFESLSVAAIAPGVLGITGVETVEVVRGVVDSIAPAAVIAVDSLASRRAARISTTVQLTDTGIEPGAGVGNLRRGLNQQTLGVPVIALGVPLVVYASTILADTIGMIADEAGLGEQEEELTDMACRAVSDQLGPMIVTPKDIDSIVRDMSGIIAQGINMALQGERYEDVRALVE